jgi:hypothetical protein
MTIFSTPTLLVYARPTKTKVPIQFLEDSTSQGASVPGFVYSLAKSNAQQAQDVAKALPTSTPVRLFSPDIDLLPHATTPARAVYNFSLTANLPTISDTAAKAAGWIQEIVRAQVDLGASAIITPSVLLDENHGESELLQILDWAARARSTPEAKGEPFLTGLILHRDWIAKPKKRELLLNHLTDREDAGYYVVVRFAAPSKSDEQIGDRRALEGLAEVVEVLADDERETVLARMGLAGWPFLALGASAASASAIPSHVFRDPVRFARKKGSPSIPRVPLYLDRKLPSYVEFAKMTALNKVSGITACGCSDCKALATGYADAQAFRHYLRTLAELRDQTVGHANPRQFALRQVKGAQALIAAHAALSLPVRTTSHLAVWESVLS